MPSGRMKATYFALHIHDSKHWVLHVVVASCGCHVPRQRTLQKRFQLARLYLACTRTASKLCTQVSMHACSHALIYMVRRTMLVWVQPRPYQHGLAFAAIGGGRGHQRASRSINMQCVDRPSIIAGSPQLKELMQLRGGCTTQEEPAHMAPT